MVCSFPMDAITSYYKCGDLKQQQFILLQLWRSGIQNEGVGRTILFQKF